MSRIPAFAWLAIAGFASFASLKAAAQDAQDAAKDQALAVRVNATLPAIGQTAAWREESVKKTVIGSPVGIRLVGRNVVILVQVTPYRVEGNGLTLITQSQVWIYRTVGGLSYRTNLDTVTVEFGEPVLFYPLGVGSEDKPQLKIEITVTQAGESFQPQNGAQGPGTATPASDVPKK